MALQSLITDLVSDAFDILDDLPVEITYVDESGNAYDSATGTVTDGSVDVTIPKAILSKFKSREVESDSAIDATTDMKILFPLKGLAIDVTTDDTFRDNKGRLWDVVKPMGVPGESLGIYHVRRRG